MIRSAPVMHLSCPLRKREHGGGELVISLVRRPRECQKLKTGALPDRGPASGGCHAHLGAGLGAAETRPAGDSRSRFPASGVESEGQPREQMHIHTFVCMCMRAFVFVYKYHVNILAMQCVILLTFIF